MLFVDPCLACLVLAWQLPCRFVRSRLICWRLPATCLQFSVRCSVLLYSDPCGSVALLYCAALLHSGLFSYLCSALFCTDLLSSVLFCSDLLYLCCSVLLCSCCVNLLIAALLCSVLSCSALFCSNLLFTGLLCHGYSPLFCPALF